MIEDKMKSLLNIQETLKQEKEFLKKRYRVKQIGIFGSYRRGQQVPGSDIDILVDLDDGVTLFDVISLENYLSDIFQEKVDIVMKDGLKPQISSQILQEVIYI